MTYYVDGSSSYAGNRIMVTTDKSDVIVSKKIRKKMTNNELEYEAIIAAAELAADGDTINSDSKLCVEQINGNFKIKQPHLKPYAEKAKKIQVDKKLTIIWLRRDDNLAGQILEKEVKANARKRNKESKTLRKDSGKQV